VAGEAGAVEAILRNSSRRSIKTATAKLTEEEMPDQMKQGFAAMDANKDSRSTRRICQAIEAFRAARGGAAASVAAAHPQAGVPRQVGDNEARSPCRQRHQDV